MGRLQSRAGGPKTYSEAMTSLQEGNMTKARKTNVAILSIASVLLVASVWMFGAPRTTHEIVIPAVQGAQR
jgi:hypothetical protein